MNNNKNKACSKTRVTTSSVISLVVGIVLVASLLFSVTTKFNQVATAQQLLLPVVPSSLLPSINNINNQLAALTQLAAAPTITTTPFLPIAGQSPLIQGSSTNGFISFLCPSNGGLVTPNPSALSFQVSSSPPVSQINPILTTTTTATSIGSFILSNSLGVPSVAGQISSGQMSGNTFTLQGTLSSITANTLSGGLSSSFCTTIATSPSTFPTFNGFTITGTCGTNVPLAFAIDRIVVGTYTANIACNNIA